MDVKDNEDISEQKQQIELSWPKFTASRSLWKPLTLTCSIQSIIFLMVSLQGRGFSCNWNKEEENLFSNNSDLSLKALTSNKTPLFYRQTGKSIFGMQYAIYSQLEEIRGTPRPH